MENPSFSLVFVILFCEIIRGGFSLYSLFILLYTLYSPRNEWDIVSVVVPPAPGNIKTLYSFLYYLLYTLHPSRNEWDIVSVVTSIIQRFL